MELGTGLFTCQRRPGDDRSRTELYEEMLAVARAADDAGLDSAWVSEHHFAEDGYLSGTTPALGALAAETDDLEVGTCIALAPFYDPVRLAEDAATLDLLSGGRATVGLSIGYRDEEFEGFGVPKGERVPRTEEAVRVLRAAWSDGPLGFDPEFHPISGEVSVTPKPEGDPSVVLGGAAKPAVRRAARLGDGWVAPSSLSVEDVQVRREDVARVREEEGIDGEFTTYVLRHGFVADSREAAWEAMTEGYFYMQRKYAEWYGGEPVESLSADRKRELEDQAVFGTPEQVTEELEGYRDALGEDAHVILRTYQPGAGREAMVECVRRLGETVRPALA